MAGQNASAYLYGSKAISNLQVPTEGAGSIQKMTAMLYCVIPSASDSSTWVEMFLDGDSGSQRLAIPAYHHWFVKAYFSQFGNQYSGDYENLNFACGELILTGIRNDGLTLVGEYVDFFNYSSTAIPGDVGAYGDTIGNGDGFWNPTGGQVEIKVEKDLVLNAIRFYAKRGTFCATGFPIHVSAILDIYDMKATKPASASS